MSLRFWYEVEPVDQRLRLDSVFAAVEVDPGGVGLRALRDGLQPWAEDKLRESRCDLGLYIADLSAWAGDAQEYYVRALYIMWSGDGPMCVYVEDNSRVSRVPI